MGYNPRPDLEDTLQELSPAATPEGEDNVETEGVLLDEDHPLDLPDPVWETAGLTIEELPTGLWRVQNDRGQTLGIYPNEERAVSNAIRFAS